MYIKNIVLVIVATVIVNQVCIFLMVLANAISVFFRIAGVM